jgi:hypothetical protein
MHFDSIGLLRNERVINPELLLRGSSLTTVIIQHAISLVTKISIKENAIKF